jgi:hypothetical protein
VLQGKSSEQAPKFRQVREQVGRISLVSACLDFQNMNSRDWATGRSFPKNDAGSSNAVSCVYD